MTCERSLTTIDPRGKFIVLYGMNNLGKTTQAKLLAELLQEKGHKAKYLKYPIYDLEPTGPEINAYLRQGGFGHLSALEIQGKYAQNRRDFEPSLKAILESGFSVVAEDYRGTGLAWGQINGAKKEELFKMNEGMLQPDLEILFDGERFGTGHETGHRHEGISSDQWDRGRRIHQELARELGWEVILANGSITEVTERLLREVEPLFTENGERRI